MRSWQGSSGRALTAVAAVLLVLAGATFHLQGAATFFAFAVLIAIFEVTLPNDLRFTLGLAPALGFALQGVALTGRTSAVIPTHTASETLVVFALGLLVAAGMRAIARKPARIADMATHVLSLAAAAGIYNLLASVPTLPAFHTAHAARASADPFIPAISIAGSIAMLLTVLGVHTIAQTIQAVARERIPFIPVLMGTVRSTGALHLSVLSVGALLAIAYPSLRYWSFPLFLAPLAATQFAFRQFASIRVTYLQTIRALSKVPEMAGYSEKGHSTRTAEIAVAIARELGVEDQETAEIEYAALLHDIGRVSIPDPEMAPEYANKAELAIVGAGIVRETGHFPRVAQMIERQHEPYRRRGEDANRDVPAGARIIKVASAYDDFTRPGGIGVSSWDALERLHAGMAFEFDPIVIQALTRTLEKRGEI
jgi:putative nucleotidyltransferase with HDIG domain